ncbi:YgaP family membrane protein [Desulfocastanea catecholica]
MKKNVGGIDRQLRFFFGAFLLLMVILAPLDPIWRIVMLVMAIIAFFTAMTRY